MEELKPSRHFTGTCWVLDYNKVGCNLQDHAISHYVQVSSAKGVQSHPNVILLGRPAILQVSVLVFKLDEDLHTRFAGGLLHNWVISTPADFTVISPLGSTLIAEAGTIAGSAVLSA